MRFFKSILCVAALGVSVSRAEPLPACPCDLGNVSPVDRSGLDLVFNIDFFDLCYAADNYPTNLFLSRYPDSCASNSYYPSETLEKLIRKAADSGFTRINFRVSARGRAVIRSKVKEWRNWGAFWGGFPNMEATLDRYDPLKVAVVAAHREGLKIYAWVTPFDEYEGITESNTAYRVKSHDGSDDVSGLPCFACQPVQDYFLSHYREVLDYGVDGLFLSDRTHSNIDGKKRIYGWNQPVVERYESLYGELDPNTAREILAGKGVAFKRFSEVQGSFYTDFLVALKKQCDAAGARLAAKASWSSDSTISYRLTSLDKSFFEWKRWIDGGIVDELVIGGDGATSWEEPFVLPYYDISTSSVRPEYYRDAIPRRDAFPIYRWLTLWSWGWSGQEELATGLTAYRSFSATTVDTMLQAVSGTSLDGVYMHEALNIIIADQWDVYRKYSGSAKRLPEDAP